jgi:ribonuclease J
MSSIKFIPFGGINERGKNCYILEINNEIIIINSGTLIPNIKRLGIEQFIPDFT